MSEMSKDGLYEKVLKGLFGTALPQPPPPRHSASVVLWRRKSATAGGGTEVYWVRRSETMPFMGGWYAFPGGGLSRRDADIVVSGEPQAVAQAPEDGAYPETLVEGLSEIAPILVPGLLACALRELFEETGILLTEESVEPDRLRDLLALRSAILGREARFQDALSSLGLNLGAAELVYAGRWLTPPLGPLRFDNRFFLLEWPESRRQQPQVLPGELELGEWVEPAKALERWRKQEVLAAPPILYLLEVLQEPPGPAVLHRLHRPVGVNLGPFRKVEFVPGILLFPLAAGTLPPATHTNCYLIGTGDAVLVDPGCAQPQEIQRLLAGLQATDREVGRKVHAVWLTHHHPDHVGAVNAVREALGVPVLAHPETAQRLRSNGISVDETLRDGQEIHLPGEPDVTLRVVHTPGHARGHLCFHESAGRWTVCGDLVAGFGTIVVDPPEGNMQAYLNSLARIRDLAPGVLLPGHGPVIRNGAAKCQEYIDHRMEREQRILTAWLAGAKTPAEIIPSAYADVPPLAHPLAERQILAHLERLESIGALHP